MSTTSCRGNIRVSRECPFALRRIRRSEPGSQRVAQSSICAVPHPGDVSIGSDQHGSGGGYLAHLTVDAAAMHAAGHAFYQAANGVWLTDHVPLGDLSGWPG